MSREIKTLSIDPLKKYNWKKINIDNKAIESGSLRDCVKADNTPVLIWKSVKCLIESIVFFFLQNFDYL